MMTIYDRSNQVTQGDTTVSADIPVQARSIALYVKYQKGTESELKIVPLVKEDTTGDYFPIQQFDGTTVTNLQFELLDTGNYRLIIPTLSNEELVRIEASLEGSDLSAPGTAEIYVIPIYYQY